MVLYWREYSEILMIKFEVNVQVVVLIFWGKNVLGGVGMYADVQAVSGGAERRRQGPFVRSLKQLMKHSRTLVSTTPSKELAQQIQLYSTRFKSVETNDQTTFLTFHASLPPEKQIIKYRDVERDDRLTDFASFASQMVWSSGMFNPNSRVILVTDTNSDFLTPEPTLSIVRQNFSPEDLMYERVKSVTAYVHSDAFKGNTIFLDTDAIPNRCLDEVFNDRFDVGVTLRTRPGFMPINEGVIFASVRDRSAVRAFFNAYVATYEKMIADPIISQYYGNIKRWRGGQLALSAISTLAGECIGLQKCLSTGAEVMLFPCDTHNYPLPHPAPLRGKVLDKKYILHLKGARKKFLGSVIAYQKQRFGTS